MYTVDVTRTPHFHDFLLAYVVGTHEEYNKNTFWAQLTGEVYAPSSARVSMIRLTTYILLHILIAISLTHHKNSERVCKSPKLLQSDPIDGAESQSIG